MTTLKSLKDMIEAKQVGTIYHYTTVNALHSMLHQKIKNILSTKNTFTIVKMPTFHNTNSTGYIAIRTCDFRGGHGVKKASISVKDVV